MSVCKSCRKAFLLICLSLMLIQGASAQASIKNQKEAAKRTIRVLNVVGLQLRDAKILLSENGINMGAVVGPADSSENRDSYYIYRQIPQSYKKNGAQTYMRQGQLIDVFIRERKVSIPVQILNRGRTRANDFNRAQRIKMIYQLLLILVPLTYVVL